MQSDFDQTLEIIQEKSVAVKFFEIVHRRLPSHLLKKIKLDNQQPPVELHNILIKALHEGTRKSLVRKEFSLRNPKSFRTNLKRQ